MSPSLILSAPPSPLPPPSEHENENILQAISSGNLIELDRLSRIVSFSEPLQEYLEHAIQNNQMAVVDYFLHSKDEDIRHYTHMVILELAIRFEATEITEQLLRIPSIPITADALVSNERHPVLNFILSDAIRSGDIPLIAQMIPLGLALSMDDAVRAIEILHMAGERELAMELSYSISAGLYHPFFNR